MGTQPLVCTDIALYHLPTVTLFSESFTGEMEFTLVPSLN